MSIHAVAISAVRSVFSSVAAIAVGAYLARRRLLHPRQTLKDLGKGIVSTVLLPCLIVTKLSQAATPAAFRHLWVLPACAAIFILVGAVVGALVSLSGPPRYRPFCMCMLSFTNAVGLPLPVIESVVRSVPWLQQGAAARDAGGGSEASDALARQVDYASSLIFVYALVVSLTQWSVGFQVMRRAATTAATTSGGTGTGSCAAAATPPSAVVVAPRAAASSDGAPAPAALAAAPRRRLFCSSQWRLSRAARSGARAARAFINPPLAGYLCGLAIGLCAPVRAAFVGSPPFLVMDTLGRACVPLILLMLGGNMALSRRGAGSGAGGGRAGSRPGGAGWRGAGRVPRRLVLLLVGARLLLMPALAAAALYLCHRGGVLPRGEDTSLIIIAAMIEQAAPTAMNMALICTIVGVFERDASEVIFAMHLCAVVTLTLWLSLTLYVLQPPA
eukprot:g2465.t1